MKATSESSREDALSRALPPDRSYDPQFFAKIAAVEDRHFWFRARNDVIANAVVSLVSGLPSGYRLLEVGCGTGVVLRHLAEVCQRGSVLGLDLYPEAVSYARERTGREVVVGDILSPPESLGQFDIIGMFDVLEHLPDERQTLMAIDRVLKPGGSLVLTVPAHPSLWSYFDVAACHCRRYDRQQLEKLLQENQFRITYLTEFMMVLYPLMWLLRRINGRDGITPGEAAAKASSELKVVPVMNSILKILLRWEPLALKLGMTIPIGTSLVAVAEKKGK